MNNPMLYLFGKFWNYGQNKKEIIFYYILFIFANLIDLLDPLVVGLILNVIQSEGLNSSNVWKLIGMFSIFLLIIIVFWIFHGPARYIERKNSFLVSANYKMYLLDGVLNLPQKWHTDHHSGDTIDKVKKGSDSFKEFGNRSFEIVEMAVRFLVSLIILIYFNFQALYIVLFLSVLTIITILKFDKVIVRNFKKLNEIDNEISAKIYDVLSNITTIIVLRIEKLQSRLLYKKIMSPFKLYKKNSVYFELKWMLVSLYTTIATFLVLATYIWQNVNLGVQVGTIYLLYGYVSRINDNAFQFAYRYGDIVRWRSDIFNSEELSDNFIAKNKIKNYDLSKAWNYIDIRNLNFSYSDENKELHLNDLNLTINKGDKIAVIGESGSGKTTFLKIIRDLYEPNELNLSVDGKFLKKGFKEISDNITLIPQDPELFNTTIRENISMGAGYKLDKIKKFSDMARFTSVVNKLPHKWNSSIMEKGVNLSGGEKQRLALARGLILCENKSIILFDEATSSVDSKNELEIYETLLNNYKDKTLLASIHRLHLLPLFDRIIMFKDGKIVGDGTFLELLNNKLFKRQWDNYQKYFRIHGDY